MSLFRDVRRVMERWHQDHKRNKILREILVQGQFRSLLRCDSRTSVTFLVLPSWLHDGCHSSHRCSTKASQAGRKEADGNGTFPLVWLLNLYQKGQFFIDVTRRVPHIFHWLYISPGHMSTLWQREMRFLGLVCTYHYSAPRLCTLPFGQNLGSVSTEETGSGC